MADIENRLKVIEEKLDFLIFMQSKTIQQPGTLAGQRPRIMILQGETLFAQWQESKRKAAANQQKLKEDSKPLPDENPNQNPDG